MDDTTPISAMCLTYGRPHLLEEAVFSFLHQDYRGPKELIILNDLKEQSLSFEHAEVHIINIPRRFHSLGEKRNAAVALASHDILFPWDDDDISLPHRLSFSMRHLFPERGYFKPDSILEWNAAAISGPTAHQAHACCCFTRDLFQRLRGYAPLGKGEDTAFEKAVERLLGRDKNYLIQHPSEAYYLYRWRGTNSYHASGKAHPSLDADSVNKRVADYVRTQLDAGVIPDGPITLEPKWHADYDEMVAAYIRQQKQPSRKEDA
jgi:hypothetical protein